ncbi:MAG: hypothetical protein LBS14_03420 [Holosporaceae bacterium]|jgi:hypothetical protein|nr:hypothetical protein [Holosporaceae bacterium]
MKWLALFVLFSICLYVEAESFVVEVVEVKECGKNSLEAKQTALSRAYVLAFRQAMAGWVGLTAARTGISWRQAKNCLYDYSIDQEKSSDSCYIARVTCRFHRKKMAVELDRLGISDVLRDEAEEDRSCMKMAVYLNDFLKMERELKKLNILVVSFTNWRVIFSITRKNFEEFCRLQLRYAPIT